MLFTLGLLPPRRRGVDGRLSLAWDRIYRGPGRIATVFGFCHPPVEHLPASEITGASEDEWNQQGEKSQLCYGKSAQVEPAPLLTQMFPFGRRMLCRPMNYLVVQGEMPAQRNPAASQEKSECSHGPVAHCAAGRAQPEQAGQECRQPHHHQGKGGVRERGNDPLHDRDVGRGIKMVQRRHQSQLDTE